MSNSKDAVLATVVSQNLEAAEQIKSASNELEVVHAVLTTHVPAKQVDADVVAAVDRTDEIGQQLADTAEALVKSTELLRQMGADGGGKSA
ncbi:MAG: hypothetical protein EON54_16745 [Alcaligenaceae bacterium]|nr:MAG: hypothetical protein EON54_16745 [Alcaligenaceae bacterium]